MKSLLPAALCASALCLSPLTGAAVAQPNPARCSAQVQASELGELVDTQLKWKRVGKAAYRRPAGVRVRLQPAAGMNGPLLLQRAMCLAASAEDNHPLAVPGLTLSVRAAGPYYELHIDGPTVAAVREVEARLRTQSL